MFFKADFPRRMSLCVLGILFCRMLCAVELTFNIADGGTNVDSCCHFVPIAYHKYGIISRGNVVQKFDDETMPKRLADYAGLGPACMWFSKGRLQKVVLHRQTTKNALAEQFFAAETITNTLGVLSHWRKKDNSGASEWKYWEKSNRLRLWFFNPNGAGTLFAEIAVLFLISAIFCKYSPVWRGLFVVAGLVACGLLQMTGSRGSLLSLLSGLGVCVLFFCKLKSGTRCFWVSIGCLLIVCGVVSWGMWQSRNGLISIDASNIQRIRAWVAAPAMLAAAPFGWGAEPGLSYDDWFQVLSDSHPLIYLVNTHLTWMVQYGWIFAFAYVALWIFVFISLARDWRSQWSFLALAVWIVFFVANWFSTVGIFWTLWLLPAMMLALSFVHHRRMGLSAGKRLAFNGLAAATASALVVGTMVFVGHRQLSDRTIPISRDSSGTTYVGTGLPMTYLVPDKWALARFSQGSVGHDIRSWLERNPSIGTLAIVDSIDKLPRKAGRVVLTGLDSLNYVRRLKNKESRKNVCRPDELIFLVPPFPEKTLTPAFYRSWNAKIYTGEFLAALTGDRTDSRRPWLNIVPGCELYLPDWPKIVFGRERR